METRLRERLVLTANAFLLAGGIALAGCSSPAPESPPSVPVVTYDAPEIANTLPAMPERLPAPSSNTYIDSGMLAYGAKPESFTYLFNPTSDQDKEKRLYELPAGSSAPVLDVMIGTDGKFRFKSYGVSAREEEKLLGVVNASSGILGAALRSGDVRQVHFRVFKPRQFPANPELEPTSDIRVIEKDFNDNGQPAIYYYFAARGYQDTEAASLLLTHESSHVLLEQHETVPPTEEQKEAFTQACTLMQQSALEYVKKDSYLLTSKLDWLKRISPKKFGPAYDAVSKAIRQGTFAQLPAYNPNKNGSIPACYLQNPWEAFAQQVREQNINGANFSPLYDIEYFEPEMNELVEDWHDLLKESAIYKALSESTYLSPKGENKKIGHPYENVFELTASTTDLLLRVPAVLGEHVSDLPVDLKNAVLSVMSNNVAKLKDLHKADPELVRFVDQQYKNFLAKVK